jgi:hypothetical protein
LERLVNLDVGAGNERNVFLPGVGAEYRFGERV